MRIDLEVKGTQGVIRTMGKIQRWANLEVPKLTFDQAEEGKRFAASIAPRKTGQLINNIAVASRRGKGFALISRMPKGQNRAIPRPYHYFMHGIRADGFPYYDTRNNIRTGDPRFMFTTAEYLRKRYPDKILKSLDRTIK